MNQSSSSTSSSRELVGDRLEAIAVVAWCLLFLALADVAVNRLFPYRVFGGGSPSQLAVYFDYGRSIEAKVRRLVGSTDDETHALAISGWLEGRDFKPSTVGPGKLLVANYGMSFSNRVCDALEELDPGIVVRSVDGPGATLNHSYAAYLADRGKHEAEVVLLGVLADSLPRLFTLTHMTAQFEEPAPHFFPRYDLIGRDAGDDSGASELRVTEPAVHSLAEFREALNSRGKWRAMRSQLEVHDVFYDSFLFNANAGDHSAIVRMIRRAWGQRHTDRVIARFHDRAGFRNTMGLIDTSRRIIREFARQARSDGTFPIVLVIDNRGYDDHLYRILEPVLQLDAIPYISTHEIAPSQNLNNFLPDGHFKPEIDRELAAALLFTLRREGLR